MAWGARKRRKRRTHGVWASVRLDVTENNYIYEDMNSQIKKNITLYMIFMNIIMIFKTIGLLMFIVKYVSFSVIFLSE